LGLPVDSWNGLRNYGLFVNDTYSLHKLTLNVGARYDRYRIFLPEQERAASRFSAQAAHFDAVSSVKVLNHVAPRIGAIYDLTGDDRTVSMLNLSPSVLALPAVNRIFNPDGYEANYKNVEIGLNKRFSRKWSMVGSFLYTWTDEFTAQYLGGGLFANGSTATNPSLFGGFGSSGFPLSPNDDMKGKFT